MRGAAETRRNLLELSYSLLQGSYIKTINYKSIPHTKFIKIMWASEVGYASLAKKRFSSAYCRYFEKLKNLLEIDHKSE